MFQNETAGTLRNTNAKEEENQELVKRKKNQTEKHKRKVQLQRVIKNYMSIKYTRCEPRNKQKQD
jgi:hypothetical protein